MVFLIVLVLWGVLMPDFPLEREGNDQLFIQVSKAVKSQRNSTTIDSIYRNKLDSLLEEDQRVRGKKFIRASRQQKKWADKKQTKKYMQADAMLKEWYDTDSSNVYYLLNLIETRGFPSEALVGDEGYISAVTILLHFDRDKKNKVLRPVLDEALRNELIAPRDYAMVIDRHLEVNGDKKQYYEWGFCDFLSLAESEKEEVLEERHKIGLNHFSFKCSTFGKRIVIE